MRSIFKSLLVFGLVSLSLARPQDNILQGRAGYDDGDDHDSNDDSHTSTSSAAASTATGSVTSANTALVGMQGDSVCTGLMCIGGFVNGTSVTYTLQSQSSSSVGWMAMGFGSQMANTPMVIMWPNSDGKITLSQRKSTGEFMPTVDSSPARTATAQAALSTASGSNPKLVFTIPQDSTVGKSIIWAYGNTNPGSDAVDATLVQHLNSGPTSLNLANTLAASDRDPTDPAVSTLAGGTTSDSGSGSGSSGSVVIPLLNYQKMLIAHGVLCTIGFLLLLPAGALLARYLRSFSNAWFKGHWIIQVTLAGPIIVAGVALAIAAISNAGAPHLDDDHKRWGLAIFVLYFVQLAFGGVIHFVKPRSFTVERKRPLQNYFHAVLGLIIIALAFYQVRTGFKTEWSLTTGRAPVPNAANIVWYIWVVLMPLLYAAGLLFLRRQLKQERSGIVKQDPATSSQMSQRS